MELNGNKLKLSHITKRLASTVPETSRNLSRLSEAGLIRRSADASFSLTPLEEESLRLLSGYEFISRNSGYFMNHTISGLPYEFAYRIGELVNCTFTNDVMTTFHQVQDMVDEAEEYLLFISEQILTSIIHSQSEAARRGVAVRAFFPSNITPPPGSKKMFAREDETLEKAKATRPEVKFLDRVDVCLCMSEKEVAGAASP